jgi:hypothetical protein
MRLARARVHLVCTALLGLSLASPHRLAAQAVAAAPPPSPAATATALPSPEEFFGFRMGADGRLAGWMEIQSYFRRAAEASDRVTLIDVGPTTEGQRMIAALVTAPENMARLAEIKDGSRRIADSRRIGEDEARALAARQPAVVAIGCSIHSAEVGATQMANELLHQLATTTDTDWLAILRQTVVVLIPSLNPDGHRLVVDWYERTRATPFAGAAMPWLDHKYAGHDVNRDGFMMNLAESRTLAHFFYREWRPQVFLTMHQMGTKGPRFFVPPTYDPIDRNHDPLVWRTAGLLGGAMSLALEREGKSGVISSAMYDYFWPGYEDSAPLGHNIVCILTEVASVNLAVPVDVPPAELTGNPRGLPQYAPQVNFPNPWPGGTWRLRDIVDYELTAARGLLDAVARYRTEIVGNAFEMSRRAVAKGVAGDPYAYVIAQEQHDPDAAAKLVSLLLDGGVELQRAMEPFRIGEKDYGAGTDVVLMAQPHRAYAKTLLETQSYPVRRLTPNGPAERPYDVTGWTLPLQMGVAVERIDTEFDLPVMTLADAPVRIPAQIWGERRPAYYLVDARGAGGARAINRLLSAGIELAWTREPITAQGYRHPPGTVVVRHSRESRAVVEGIAGQLGLRATAMKGRVPAATSPIGGARIGLYRPWVDGIDEGWTRWVLEEYGFTLRNLVDADVKRGGLRAGWDVIVIPDMRPERLAEGLRPGTVPDEYTGGLGQTGLDALGRFAREGGTLVCLDSSCQPLLAAMQLPVSDALQSLPAETFYCPGSLVRLAFEPSSPLAFGMKEDTAALLVNGSAYDLRHGAPASAGIVSVAARYGSGNPLLSGWLDGPEHLAGKAAVVEVSVGQGRVVLVGFRPQHRGQTLATFRVLFNALFTSPTFPPHER